MILSRFSIRAGFAVVCVTSVTLVSVSLVLTELLALSPCPLCIFQRMLYLLLALPALVGWIWPRSLYWCGGASLLLSVGGFAAATYQSWLQLSAAESAACEFQELNLLERFVTWAGELAPSLFYAWGDCASAEWTFLGLSIANWSVVAFLCISILLLRLLRRAIL